MRIVAFCLTIGNIEFENDPKDEYAVIKPDTRRYLETGAAILKAR